MLGKERDSTARDIYAPGISLMLDILQSLYVQERIASLYDNEGYIPEIFVRRWEKGKDTMVYSRKSVSMNST